MVNTVSVGQNIPTTAVNTNQTLIDKIISGGRIIVGFLDPASWMEGGKHKGIDIGASPGTSIKSPVSGTLVNPQTYGLKGYGNAVTILDSSGNLHIFGHTTGTSKSYGTKVSIGDTLSTIEDYLHPATPNTGYDTSFGNHLHYEIRQPGANGLPDFNRSMNPLEYLRTVITQPSGVNVDNGGQTVNTGGGIDRPVGSTGFDVPILSGKLGPWDVGVKLNFALGLKLVLTFIAILMIVYGIFLVFGAKEAVEKIEKVVVDKVTP